MKQTKLQTNHQSNGKLIVIATIIIAAVVFALVVYYYFFLQGGIPSSGMPPPPFIFCQRDNDCVYIIAEDQGSPPEIKPLQYQICINRNYKKSDYEYYYLGSRVLRETGEDKCECKQEGEKKMCAVKLETAKVDDVSNWQTYRNEEYWFEVKYPNDWEVSNHSSGLLSLKRVEDRLSGIQTFFTINIKKNYEINPESSAIVMEKIRIGGRFGYKYFYQEGAGTSEVVLIQLAQDALELSLDYFESKGSDFNSRKNAIEEIIEPILSTFKFIEPIK